MKTQIYKLITYVVAVGLITGSAFAEEYIVQSHETLSEIAQHVVKGPVWGKHGSLSHILALNPKIENPDLIYPGQKIEVGEKNELVDNFSPEARTPAADSAATSPAQITPAQSTQAPPVVAAPAVAPVAAPLSTEAQPTFNEYSLFSVEPTFSFSRIDATDSSSGAHSTLVSALNVGAALEWRQFWSDHFQTALQFSGEAQSYSTSSANYTLDHSSFFLGNAGIETRWGKILSPQLIADLGIIQTPFIRGENATANILDIASIPTVGIGASLPLCQSKLFLMSFDITANYLAPVSMSSYNINSGYSLGGKLSLTQYARNSLAKKLEGDLFVKYFNQNSSIVNQTNLEVGVGLQFNFDVSSDKTP